MIWAVSLVEGSLRVKDWSLHLRGNSDEPEHSWSKSGISPQAKAAALKFGTYIVEQSPEHTLGQLVQVEDGWLVGFDAGEWSGGLCWISTDGTKGRFLITQPKLFVPPPPPPPGVAKRQWDLETRTPRSIEPNLPGWIPRKQFRFEHYCAENVIHIAECQGSYLVFQGRTHMSMDTGQILKVNRNANGIWEASKLLKLDGMPIHISQDDQGEWLVLTGHSLFGMNAAGKVSVQLPLPDALIGAPIRAVVAKAPGQWLVLTEANLYQLSSDGNSRMLQSGAFLANPEMNSIVRMADGTVFIGMRHYLLRLRPREDGYITDRLEKRPSR